jgi:predicted GH43/DUF377 family glycosyl hydrolase
MDNYQHPLHRIMMTLFEGVWNLCKFVVKKIMKIFIAIICILTSLNLHAQEDVLPMENNQVIYTAVITVDSANKADLFRRAKKWIQHQYNTPKDVIQIDDAEGGEIGGAGSFKINYYSRSPFITHHLNIMVKDGRYKYRIDNIRYSDNKGENFSIESFPQSWAGKNKLYKSIDEHIQEMIATLQSDMKTSDKSDW